MTSEVTVAVIQVVDPARSGAKEISSGADAGEITNEQGASGGTGDYFCRWDRREVGQFDRE